MDDWTLIASPEKKVFDSEGVGSLYTTSRENPDKSLASDNFQYTCNFLNSCSVWQIFSKSSFSGRYRQQATGVSVSGMSSYATIMASALVWQLYWPLSFLLPLHIAILAISIGLIGNCRTPPTVVPTLPHTISTIITATSFSACFKCFNFPIFVTCLQVC